ncbi:hypothetical protein DEU56DRAFT_757839 [Suillus clintonianus]|uniref:uncharacterized protein n=1 Tax=Suillus clintonianus TaxID=1904413 RepID=UPI001B866F30|nr:uncharacterized protein DEU56DRAFT_757839 [Suillus clintonianus]KAG2130345.1 hypothetical protein DEU56DRAFT_757839 [Suillus clintonianus]
MDRINLLGAATSLVPSSAGIGTLSGVPGSTSSFFHGVSRAVSKWDYYQLVHYSLLQSPKPKSSTGANGPKLNGIEYKGRQVSLTTTFLRYNSIPKQPKPKSSTVTNGPNLPSSTELITVSLRRKRHHGDPFKYQIAYFSIPGVLSLIAISSRLIRKENPLESPRSHLHDQRIHQAEYNFIAPQLAEKDTNIACSPTTIRRSWTMTETVHFGLGLGLDKPNVHFPPSTFPVIFYCNRLLVWVEATNVPNPLGLPPVPELD